MCERALNPQGTRRHGASQWIIGGMTLLLIGGCAYTPATREFDPKSFDRVAVGQSRAEVLSHFGRPTLLETDRFFVYRFSRIEGTRRVPVPMVTRSWDVGQADFRLAVEFDSRGRVAHYAITGSDMHITSGEFGAPPETVIVADGKSETKWKDWTPFGIATLAVGTSSNGQVIAWVNGEHLVRVNGGSRNAHADIPSDVDLHQVCVAVSPLGDRIALVHPNVRLYETHALDHWQLLKTSPAARATAATFSPDGRRLVTGDERGGIHVWDAESGELQGSWQGHGAPVRSLAFDSAGERLASAAPRESLKIWEAATWTPIGEWSLPGDRVTLSPDGHQVAVAYRTGFVEVWDIDRTEPVAGEECPVITNVFLAMNDEDPPHVAFSADGQKLLVNGNALYGTGSWRPVWRSNGHVGCAALCSSSDNMVVAVPRAIQVWKVSGAVPTPVRLLADR